MTATWSRILPPARIDCDCFIELSMFCEEKDWPTEWFISTEAPLPVWPPVNYCCTAEAGFVDYVLIDWIEDFLPTGREVLAAVELALAH